jgi:hypothetical protein
MIQKKNKCFQVILIRKRNSKAANGLVVELRTFTVCRLPIHVWLDRRGAVDPPCMFACLSTNPMLASWSSCEANLSSGAWFGSPARICPSIYNKGGKALNSYGTHLFIPDLNFSIPDTGSRVEKIPVPKSQQRI